METILLIGEGYCWFFVDIHEEGHDAIHEVLPLVLVDVY